MNCRFANKGRGTNITMRFVHVPIVLLKVLINAVISSCCKSQVFILRFYSNSSFSGTYLAIILDNLRLVIISAFYNKRCIITEIVKVSVFI